MAKPELARPDAMANLIDQAGALLDRLAVYVTTQQDLHAARDLVRCACYRGIGPHRAACNAHRLAAACERARRLLGELLCGVCPSCSCAATFTPIGEQEDPDGPSIALANCDACGSTISSADVLPIGGAR